MKVLGLGYDGFHDSNISLMEDGKVVSAISEERLSGIKKDGRFPNYSLQYINAKDIDILCVSNLPDKEFYKEYKKAGIKPDNETIRERSRIFENINSFSKNFKKVVFVSHHNSHAASAYYFSGFDSALVITWDAGNNSEPWNFTIQIGTGTELRRVEQSLDAFPALNYTAITALLGFKPGRHEGKITGLAAHGEVRSDELWRVKELLKKFDNKHTLIGLIATWENVGSTTESPVLRVDTTRASRLREDLGISRENLAAIIQHLTEEHVLRVVRTAKNKYAQKNICLAGGLFANVLLNKKIKELGFKNIYIHPAMGDDGLALGASSYFLASREVLPTVQKTVFWGPFFDAGYVEKVLQGAGLPYERPHNPAQEVAERLANGKIVACFDGAMEYGPRALGNRSILASAADKDINRTLNERLNRTEFMPFAPITLEEDAGRYYSKTMGMEYAMKFMTIAADCTTECQEEVPAITHIDGTARPQLVGEENPHLREILFEYRQKTGHSTLVNTSFNVHEKPIVCTPEDAVKAFKQSRLDCLAIEDFIVSRK